MLSAARRGARDERGQVIVFFALLIPVLFAIGAIVIDVGNWYVHKRHLQTQVDAAVLASAPSFAGCFFDQPSANSAVASQALEYAGDTLRDANTTNRQLAEPNDVRVVLNADRYWNSSDGTGSPSNGYGLDWGGNNPAKMPCATSWLDAKATDEQVKPLWGLIPLFPSPKTHAKVEIRRVREQSGFLPLGVPEIDPNYVYALYVDYSGNGTQTPLAVQELVKDPTYLAPNFLYSAWVTKAGQESVTIQPNNTYSDGTGIVLLVSKNDTPPSTTGTLNQICGQTPTQLIHCWAGTGAAYDGNATGQGVGFIHSFKTGGGSPNNPQLRDVNVSGTVCTPAMSPGNQSPPYFTNDDNDCTATSVTVKVDFGVPGDPTKQLNATPTPGICARVTSSAGVLNYVGTAGTVSTWTLPGGMSLPAAGGPQKLNLSYSDKTTGVVTNCNSPNNSGSLSSPGTAPYSANDASGPVGYVHVTASGPNAGTSCPAGSTVPDANSIERGNYCMSVAVGLEKPLGVQPWNFPDLTLRFASKSARKGGSGTANLNGSLLCDAGRTLTATFTTGCYTTYGLNYDKWGTSISPACTPGAYCWKDVLCSAYPPSSLPPASTVNDPPPICIAAKNGTVQAFEAGVYNRFEDPGNGYGGCTPNYWPKTQAEADLFFKPVNLGGHDFTNDPRYITLIVTDNTAFSSPNTAEPVKYFAGFYVTGWDTANGSGNPHGCYSFPPSANTCGAPNNDAHPLLGCLAGKVTSADNGDLWGHFVKFVNFSSKAQASKDLCALTSTSAETCVAVLVE